ncbi:hypothetical protein KM043_016994 [Ampulex compressa]|nr:hypothetical protein KM043_016994 [Ampulex compressa]
MFSLVALWLIAALIVVWLLSEYIIILIHVLREILIPILNPKPIDFRAKYGDWAVVTGSTDGIGKAYAKELAGKNMNLVLISRSLEKMKKTKEEILNINPKLQVKIIIADFSKGKDAFKNIESELKDIPVGILVNNVGSQYPYPMYLGEVAEDVLWDVITVNVGAATLMTRMVINQMKERRKGAIVNISSGTEYTPVPLMAVYAASKLYMKSFSDAVRAEYSKFGITIQHLTPFFVNTKMNAFSDRLQVSSLFNPSATTYAKNAINTLGRMNSSTGYWAHGIQKPLLLLSPVWLTTKIDELLAQEKACTRKCADATNRIWKPTWRSFQATSQRRHKFLFIIF